jgi:hypothetical protein
MAKTKVLKLLKGATQAAGEIPRVTSASRQPLQPLDEFVRTQNAIDAAQPIADPSVQEAIRTAEQAAAENARLTGIADPKADVRFDHQARTPEEYAGRLEQFKDETYANKAAAQAAGSNMENPLDELKDVSARYERWNVANERVANATFRNDRALNSEVQEFTFDGVYKADFVSPNGNPTEPAIFYHTDIFTDPRAAEKGLIQFDPAAREVGLHAGSAKAADDIKGSPTVRARQEKNIEDLHGVFRELAEQQDLPIDEYFEDAFEQVRTNLFLRAGETPHLTPDMDIVNQIVDDMFDEIQALMLNRTDGDMMSAMSQLSQKTTPELLKKRLREVMRGAADPNTFAFVTDVKQGLHVPDLGNNTSRNFAKDLQGRGIFDDDELQVVISAGSNEGSNVAFRELLERHGYDHLIQHNGAEDLGVPSIIIWDEKHIMPITGPNASNTKTAMDYELDKLLGPLAAVLGIGSATLQSEQ